MSNPADPNRATRMYRAATPVEEEDIHPGAIVGSGRFKIFGIIGRGKMASVFRARDLRRNADIALKVLARKFVGHQAHERRFDNEARLAGRLQGHRNVVAPIESGRLDDCAGRMFLAMELVNGPTLTDLVSMNGPLAVEEACMYMRDVARALRDMHQSGVVHRDIKPDNVLLGRFGQVFLTDDRFRVWEFADETPEDERIRAKYGLDAPQAGAGAADPAAIDFSWHQRNYEDALGALREGRTPSLHGQEARRAVALIEAIYRSAKAGGDKVEVE